MVWFFFVIHGVVLLCDTWCGSSLLYMVWFLFVIHGVVFCVQNVPPDLSICAFVLEQSLSVRALQEMLANTEEKAEGVSRSLQS